MGKIEFQIARFGGRQLGRQGNLSRSRCARVGENPHGMGAAPKVSHAFPIRGDRLRGEWQAGQVRLRVTGCLVPHWTAGLGAPMEEEGGKGRKDDAAFFSAGHHLGM